MSRDDLIEKYVPLVDRLSSGNSLLAAVVFYLSSAETIVVFDRSFPSAAHWFNCRASACALYPTLYKVSTDEHFKVNVLQSVPSFFLSKVEMTFLALLNLFAFCSSFDYSTFTGLLQPCVRMRPPWCGEQRPTASRP